MKGDSIAFLVGAAAGIWFPRHCKSTLAKKLYRVYTYISFIQLILVLITQFIFLLNYVKNIYDFTETAFTMITIICAIIKGIHFVRHRRLIIHLCEILITNDFKPQTNREKNLCSNYNKLSRNVELFCIIVGTLSAISISASPLIISKTELELPLKAWVHFDIKIRRNYVFIYIHQCITIFLLVGYHFTIDLVMRDLIYYTSVQLDFVICRLQDISVKTSVAIKANIPMNEIRIMEKKFISRCVQHHIMIYAYAEKLTEVLFPIILTQFTTSFSILCVTGYLLIKSPILEAVRFISYVIAMLVEIFIYNWYANEVSTKSLDFNLYISEINWTVMHVQSMKEITIMMIRSTSPIVFSCGSLIQLSLTSFMKILKISYSAMNLLISS